MAMALPRVRRTRQQRGHIGFIEPAVPARGAEEPEPPVGRPSPHRLGVHPEYQGIDRVDGAG